MVQVGGQCRPSGPVTVPSVDSGLSIVSVVSGANVADTVWSPLILSGQFRPTVPRQSSPQLSRPKPVRGRATTVTGCPGSNVGWQVRGQTIGVPWTAIVPFVGWVMLSVTFGCGRAVTSTCSVAGAVRPPGNVAW